MIICRPAAMRSRTRWLRDKERSWFDQLFNTMISDVQSKSTYSGIPNSISASHPLISGIFYPRVLQHAEQITGSHKSLINDTSLRSAHLGHQHIWPCKTIAIYTITADNILLPQPIPIVFAILPGMKYLGDLAYGIRYIERERYPDPAPPAIPACCIPTLAASR